jgi:hypothetical protein
MRNRVLLLAALGALLVLALLGCSVGSTRLSDITPTPTKTLRPLFTSTSTPTPTPTSQPSDTPLPTDTPVPTATPPPPSDTPAPAPTMQPSDTPPPTDTPVPPSPVPQPSNTPKPRATNTPLPPTPTAKPKVDFRVVEQRLMSKAENEAQRHQIMIRVIDAGGSPLNGLVVWDPNHPDQEAVTGSKPEPYHAEYLFWDYGAYQLEVKGAASEKTKVLSTEVHLIPKDDLVKAEYCPDVANCNPDELVQHYSWYVTFQRTW